MAKHSSQLTLITSDNLPNNVFEGDKLDEFLSRLEAEASSVVISIKTVQGRQEIKSLAHNIAKMKVALDNHGKELVVDWKLKSKQVDAHRRSMRNRLDSLKNKVREPLTEWENEQKRIKEQKELDAKIARDHDQALIENDLFDKQRAIEAQEKELKEKERQRLLAIEEEKAKNLAAQREQERIQEAIELERKQSEQKILNAKLAEQKAIEDRKLAEARRIANLEQQEKEKQRAIEQARQQEQERIEKELENKRKQEEFKKQERQKELARKEHVDKIHEKLMNELKSCGFNNFQSDALITDIVSKRITLLTIQYEDN